MDDPAACAMTRGQSLLALPSDPHWCGWLLLFRFGLVGLLNTGFGYTIFAVLVLAGIWPGAALAGTTAAAVVFNFQTSRRLVFRSNGPALRFIAVYIVVLAVNWAALRLLQWCGLPDLEAQALLTLPVAAVSFVGQQRFVFGAA
jgi:putative flippase GtrA